MSPSHQCSDFYFETPLCRDSTRCLDFHCFFWPPLHSQSLTGARFAGRACGRSEARAEGCASQLKCMIELAADLRSPAGLAAALCRPRPDEIIIEAVK